MHELIHGYYIDKHIIHTNNIHYADNICNTNKNYRPAFAQHIND